MLPASMLGNYSTSASLTLSNFFYVASTSWKLTSYRSALDLATLSTIPTGRLLSWLLFSFLLDRRACYSTCRWLHDFVITPSRSLRLHIARGLVRHGYPWIPTGQGHSHPRQVGPAHQKTRRPDSGPNRTNLWLRRPPEDLIRYEGDLEYTSRHRLRRQTV